MEQETTLKEILNALKMHGEQMDKRFERVDKSFEEMDKKMDEKIDSLRSEVQEGFTQVNERIDRLDHKLNGVRVDLMETQENTNFLLSKTAQHEKKIQQLTYRQQQ